MATARKRTLDSSVRKRGRGASADVVRMPTSEAAAFLAGAHPTTRTQLAGTVDLPTFRNANVTLSREERLVLVEQALVLLEQNYVHLPLKQAMHAVRPIQRLKLLEHRLRTTAEEALPSALLFHREMLEIFTSVRDLHTNYILPAPFNRMTAFLPFLLESYIEDGERRYLVGHVTEGFDRPAFAPGVEVVSWNGIPINRAVEINANRFAGSNEDARRARGIESLTIRPLIISLPPDEDWVVVGYRTNDGVMHELRVDWLVASPDFDDGDAAQPGFTPAAAAMGLDIETEAARKFKKIMFAPGAFEAARGRGRGRRAAVGADLESARPELTARVVDTPQGRFGYIRIWTFAPEDRDESVDHFLQTFSSEFIRLLDELPKDGLIIDVRGNGGGIILAGEQLLQLLTPAVIEPERMQFIHTPLNLSIVRRHSPSPFSGFDLSPWLDSMEEAVRTGATYSRAFPITPPADANEIGQRYHGPVVLITDALCYSTTDIFAAGFQDHDIGVVLGVDNNTGAGGVWGHDLLQLVTSGPAQIDDAPYESLPQGAQMRVSIRRTLRVGEEAGTPVEDLGVVPDQRHDMTRNDLLNRNVDLINHAAAILAAMPVRQLHAELVSSDDDNITVRLSTIGIDRLDIYADTRPKGSLGWSDGTTEVTITGSEVGSIIEFAGFDDDTLVAVRKLEV